MVMIRKDSNVVGLDNSDEGVCGHHIADMVEVCAFDQHQLNDFKIIHHGMDNSKYLNIFREIRTKLLVKSKRKNFTCVVSSVVGKGGGSLVSTNLAAVFALDHTKSALLADCNLYHPTVDRLVIGEVKRGLTNYFMEEKVDLGKIIYASGIKRLRVIPFGEHIESVAEHFTSEKMSDFIHELKKRYPDRFIFMDGPTVDTAEFKILSALVDFSILVVPYGKVTNKILKDAISTVSKDKLLGVVFNN